MNKGGGGYLHGNINIVGRTTWKGIIGRCLLFATLVVPVASTWCAKILQHNLNKRKEKGAEFMEGIFIRTISSSCMAGFGGWPGAIKKSTMHSREDDMCQKKAMVRHRRVNLYRRIWQRRCSRTLQSPQPGGGGGYFLFESFREKTWKEESFR